MTPRKRVILDACLPKALRNSLPEFEVQTAAMVGIDHLVNGRLLSAVDGVFDVLLTVDQGIPQQTNMRGRRIAIIVLRSKSNRIEDLHPLVPALVLAAATISPGEIGYIP